MSAPAIVSSAYIAGQQSELAATLASLEARAEDLAFAAVGGDETAVADLADINARIERANADALVLQRARAKAQELEAEAAQAARLARQAEHRAEAARQAAAFVDLVQEADAAIEAFVRLVARVHDAETALRCEVRAAGINPDTSVAGRMGTSKDLVCRMGVATDPGASYRDNPPVLGRVRYAWAFLLDEGEKADV